VSLEAQHYGVPVITYAKSGVAETIIDGITGVQFHAQTTQSLVGAIRKFETMQWNHEKIREHASKFSHVHFENQMRSLVNSLTDAPKGK
jgi:glycosyltransferase involved in cell wall biosynthesis